MSVTLRMKATSYPRPRQPAPQHVEVDRRPDVPDVRLRLHRQTAHVDARLPLLEGDEVTDLAGRGVVQAEVHPPILGKDRAPPRIADSCDSCDRSDPAGYRQQVRKPGSLLVATTVALTGLLAPVAIVAPAEAAAPARKIAYAEWDSAADLRQGTLPGLAIRQGRLALGEPAGRRTFAGRAYDTGSWVSPWRTPSFDLTELIASWDAVTPGDSWVEVSVRGRTAAGKRSSWDVLGRWAAGDKHLERTSVGGQGDDLADVNVDTWQADGALDAWRLRVTLLRGAGSRRAPGRPHRRHGQQPPRRRRRRHLGARARQRHHARRAPLLPDGPPRPLPEVGQRRAGLVLTDLDVDGARLLRRPAVRRRATPGCPTTTSTRGSTTPPG